MRGKGRCLWTVITEIIPFVLKSLITKGFNTKFVSSHCEHTEALIRDFIQAHWAAE